MPICQLWFYRWRFLPEISLTGSFSGADWTPADKKPGSLLALTPLSVAMKVKVIADIVHILVLPESISIIQYPSTLRNW